jgi:hypothetical protein
MTDVVACSLDVRQEVCFSFNSSLAYQGLEVSPDEKVYWIEVW